MGWSDESQSHLLNVFAVEARALGFILKKPSLSVSSCPAAGIRTALQSWTSKVGCFWLALKSGAGYCQRASPATSGHISWCTRHISSCQIHVCTWKQSSCHLLYRWWKQRFCKLLWSGAEHHFHSDKIRMTVTKKSLCKDQEVHGDMLASTSTDCTLAVELGKFIVDAWPHLLVEEEVL